MSSELLIGLLCVLILVLASALLAVVVVGRRRNDAHAAELAEITQARREAAEAAERRLLAADSEANRLVAEATEARRSAEEVAAHARTELAALRAAHDRREARIAMREDRLDADREAMDNRAIALTEVGIHLDAQQSDINRQLAQLAASEESVREELARVAGLPVADARAELISRLEHDARLEAASLVRDIEAEARREGESRARHLLVGAMQRLAADQTSESSVAVVDLPTDDMKGRIIGREGRNIRTFEQVTGVNLTIDDTPGVVLLSCFDPVRREVARQALVDLVTDGRIHPTSIEQAHERALARVEELTIRAAEDALVEMKITDFPADLLPTLGALRFRTSYGQNVLKHLLECGHLASLLAAELGLDVATCRRSAFLHDLGKALTGESEGSHAQVGADLLRRHGEHPDIVHAVAAHHNEVEPETVEAVLVQVVDAISGSRPGARRESLENYVKRLERLEEIASAHPGVERVFAMQAGRDVRIMVQPDTVNDTEAQALAREVAAEIERELTYPGQIRVTVVRESRATEIAR